MTSLGKYSSGLNGIMFLFSHFQRKCKPKLWLRCKHCPDWSPLSCDPINSSPRWSRLSSPGPQWACDQQCGSLRDSKPSGSVYFEDWWNMKCPGSILTPQDLILFLLGNSQEFPQEILSCKVRISLTSEGNFSEITMPALFPSVHMPLCVCYSKSERNAAFIDA